MANDTIVVNPNPQGIRSPENPPDSIQINREVPEIAAPQPAPAPAGPVTMVPMFSPNGELGDVPHTHVDLATKAGGMVASPIISPDGKHGYVPATRLHDALKAGAKIDDTGWTPEQEAANNPTLGQRLENTITGPGQILDPNALENARQIELAKQNPWQATQEIAGAGATPIVRPENFMTPEEQAAHPYLRAGSQFIGSLSSPNNLALLIATGGLAKMPGPAPQLISKALGAGFSIQQITGAIQRSPEFVKALARGDENEAQYQLAMMVLEGASAVPGAEHATGTEAHIPGGEAINAGVAKGTQAVGQGLANAGQAIAGVPGKVVSAAKAAVGVPETFFDAVNKISPASKGYAKEYAETLKKAEPQLREVMQKSPDVGTPQDLFEAIDNHIKQNDAFVASEAAKFKDKPEAKMTGIENKIRSGVEKAFKENPGQYTPEEQEKAIAAVMQHLLQPEPGQLEGTTQLREPNLDELEGIRQRFNNDTKPAFGSNAPAVSPAESFAKQEANKIIRPAIDQKFDDLGVKNVAEWRRQEAPLIDVRDQIGDAVKKSQEMGTYNTLQSLVKQFGWRIPVAMTAGLLGGAETGVIAAMGGAGLGMAADYFRDLRSNPNRMTETAARMANESKQPTGAKLPEKGPKVNPTGATEASAPGSIELETRRAFTKQNAAAGFIKPDGTFQELTEGSHPEDAEKMGTTVPQLRRKGWVRKAGQGSYDAGELNPKTRAAIENDIISDYSDLKNGNEYGQVVSHIVIDTKNGTYEIPVDDFIDKYNGDLSRAMRATSPIELETRQRSKEYADNENKNTFYHGTTWENAEKIEKEGLRSNKNYVWAATNRGAAYEYGHSISWHEYDKPNESAVIEFQHPYEKSEADPEHGKQGDVYRRIPSDVQLKYIKSIEYYDKGKLVRKFTPTEVTNKVDLETRRPGETETQQQERLRNTPARPILEYKLPNQPATPAPVDRLPSGYLPGDELDHEWGHITNAALEGWGVGEIKSHLHSSLPKQATASATVTPEDIDWDDSDSVARNIGKIASVVLGGGVANEVHSGIPFEINQGLVGDLRVLTQKLTAAGFSPDEIESVIQYGRDRAKRNLTQPGISDILVQNAKVREENLHPGLHASRERTEGYANEVRRIQDENRKAAATSGAREGTNAPGTDREAGRVNRADEPRTEGGVPKERPEANLETARGKEVKEPKKGNYKLIWEDNSGNVFSDVYPTKEIADKAREEKIRSSQYDSTKIKVSNTKEKPTRMSVYGPAIDLEVEKKPEVRVPEERTAGVHDAAIKAGGGIPGGIQEGDPDLDIPNYAIFHDPQTGSSLMLPIDKVTPENVRAQLEKSRAQYAEAETRKATVRQKVGLETSKEASGELTEKAVDKYGITNDPRKIGYILPDGRGLDFSDGKEVRTLDHGDISTILPRKGENAVPYDADPRFHFQEQTGSVRFLHTKTGINVEVPESGLTSDQQEVIARALENHPTQTLTIDLSGRRGESEDRFIGSAEGQAKTAEDVNRIYRDAQKSAQLDLATEKEENDPEKITPELAQKIADLHKENEGSTYNLTHGNMSGTDNYAVATHPGRGDTLTHPPTAEDLHDYMQKNQDLLKQSNKSMGTWHDPSNDSHTLDVVSTLPNRDEAIALAKKHNQKTIFNLKNFETIDTGGTGEAPKTELETAREPEDTSFNFGANVEPEPEPTLAVKKLPRRTSAAIPAGSSTPLMREPLEVKGTGEEGRVNTLDVAKALNKFSNKANKRLDLNEADPEEMTARAKSIMEDEARYQLAQGNSGEAWYTTQIAAHDKVLQEMRPELQDPTKLSLFKMAEAVASSGQKPYQNLKAALKIWDVYNETGKFPAVNPETGGSWGPRGIKAYGDALKSLTRLVEEKGENGASEWLQATHPVSELKEYNKNVAGRKDQQVLGAQILGPKRGPFAMNLHGKEAEFTADMWVARSWNRWMGTIETDPEEGITTDAPRSGKERDLMRQSFEQTAKKLNKTTNSLQAILWYYEQSLYSVHGVPKESWSFEDAAKRVQQEEKGAAQQNLFGDEETKQGGKPKNTVSALDFINRLKNVPSAAGQAALGAK